MSASLNFDGEMAWVEDRFARCEMRIEHAHESSIVKLGCSC